MACYTYGAPRTGNHAAAKEFDRVLPDNWSIINGSVRLAGFRVLWTYCKPKTGLMSSSTTSPIDLRP